MAEYIKFRLTAAKVGVSMALLALMAGLAEKARSSPTHVTAKTAAFDSFLNLGGITGAPRTAFLRVEQKFVKIDSALVTLEHKLSRSYFDKRQADATFLTTADASQKYLTIDDANAEFLTTGDASQKYLTIDDANADFLSITGTAANSNALGGLTADAFFQGHGNVVSGAVTVAQDGTSHDVLALPGAIIVVAFSANADEGTLTITNNTGVALPAVQEGSTKAITLEPGANLLPAVQDNAEAHQTTVQILPNGAFQDVVTLVISSEPSLSSTVGAPSTLEVVGQAFTGGI